MFNIKKYLNDVFFLLKYVIIHRLLNKAYILISPIMHTMLANYVMNIQRLHEQYLLTRIFS